jgi:putative membrane protein insertion efficiency factor
MPQSIIRKASQVTKGGLNLLITMYQKGVSVFFRPSCRFYPSCSCYAKTVIREQPLYKSLPLIIWRLARCQPLSKGGFDYPPQSHKS